ncbi:hypothetical protein SAMN02799620_03256 [Mycolicibacterium fluoranthenivorans]|uniref:Uncharacterized protein n=1 Tax=Mycolicibacterium fluoranthenivorans TaxID=258505 RepID=A0A1G4WG85_9MYCO|nr:hypothetical protein SAMN02799620_03256 [Mycolicibacterium fluoranthenivorans]
MGHLSWTTFEALEDSIDCAFQGSRILLELAEYHAAEQRCHRYGGQIVRIDIEVQLSALEHRAVPIANVAFKLP